MNTVDPPQFDSGTVLHRSRDMTFYSLSKFDSGIVHDAWYGDRDIVHSSEFDNDIVHHWSL